MITAIVRRLQTDNDELQGYCANAIFKVTDKSFYPTKVINQAPGEEIRAKMILVKVIWKLS